MSWRDDVNTVLERDPAPRSFTEALMFSPGLHAILLQRISHRLYLNGNYTLARFINYWGRVLTGADIHPGARIGRGFFIDHATGVVIGETSEIGDNVSIYQGVTLGGVSTSKGKRHPTIGNNVVIGAHATILGAITIGDCVRVGAGSVVVKDVPPSCTVVGIPGKVVRRNGSKEAPRIDLRHDQLPDPLLDTLNDMLAKIHDLDERLQSIEEKISKS